MKGESQNIDGDFGSYEVVEDLLKMMQSNVTTGDRTVLVCMRPLNSISSHQQLSMLLHLYRTPSVILRATRVWYGGQTVEEKEAQSFFCIRVE